MDQADLSDDRDDGINSVRVVDRGRRQGDGSLTRDKFESTGAGSEAAVGVGRDIPGGERAQLRPPLGMVAASACGAMAALFYALANIALRYSVAVDPFLVSAVKAAPTVLLLGPLLIFMYMRGKVIATSGRMIPRLAAAALLAQIFGNGAFQVALGIIGLAASVPITLGVLVIGGAVLGRIVLGEPVRLRSMVSIVILISAVIVLSVRTDTPQPAVSNPDVFLGDAPIWFGALCAAASGAGYAVFGVAMRQAMNGGLSVPASMFVSGMVGTIVLWSITFQRIGFDPLADLSLHQWCIMFAAGACNFTAFVALSVSLKSLPVVAVNLINASQVAISAVAGVLLFAEPITWPLVAGIALTFAGLGILARGRGHNVIRTSR